MKRLYGFFAIIILSFTIAACGLPAGTIGGSSFDELMAVPHRVTYNVGDVFSRSNDLSVFAVSRGNVQSVEIELVQIGIDTLSSNDEIEIVPPVTEGFYPFRNAGRRVVVVTYGTLTENYSIEVRDPHGIENGGNGNGGGGENVDGIEIAWAPFIRILTHPTAVTGVTQGNIIDQSLSVRAVVSQNATLSYQWFSNIIDSNSGGDPTAIEGQTGESFTIPATLTAGDHYYYFVEITAPRANPARSRVARVIVSP